MRERPAPEFDRRHHLRRLGRADAGHPRQIAAGRSRDAVNAAAQAKQLVGHLERIRFFSSAAENQRDQFVIAKSRRPVAQQLLARSIVGR